MRDLSVIDYTEDLREIAGLVGEAPTREVLDRALHALAALVPYDLATVFRLEGQRLRVLAAAGPLANAQVRGHELLLERYPTVRRALETRRPIALRAHDHADEGDPFDGVLDLPHGHACMVVPLYAGDRSLGVITLDGSTCGVYPPEHVQLAGVYGQLVALALRLAEQTELLDRFRLQLREQNRLLAEEAGGADVACQRLEANRSPAMRDLVRLARQVAASHLPVLLLGETGVGKEVAAQAVHVWSGRAGPFVRLNCSAVPENLVESELFGHVRGAFSGADRDRRGRFLTANGGTLLLDEIGDMPLAAQAKLLRVLQERTFEPVGSDKSVRVDVRVIAATHVDLKAAISAGKFREDLYYRLAVFPLRLPALRERPEDVVPMAEDFLANEARRGRGGPWRIGPACAAAMRDAPWRGNVRELMNNLERATILRPAGELTPEDLGLEALAPRARPSAGAVPSPSAPDAPLPDFEENERRYLAAVLAHAGNRLYGAGSASEITGLKPTTLRSRLVKLGLR